MKTNEQIFEEIKKQGYITEQQIMLLKRRGEPPERRYFRLHVVRTRAIRLRNPPHPRAEQEGRKFLA